MTGKARPFAALRMTIEVCHPEGGTTEGSRPDFQYEALTRTSRRDSSLRSIRLKEQDMIETISLPDKG